MQQGRSAHIAGGVQLLAPILRGAAANAGGQPPNQQLLYDAGLATWELTFHRPAVQLMPQSGAVQACQPVDPEAVPCAERLAPALCNFLASWKLGCLCSGMGSMRSSASDGR
jgi:hypothetical protein